MSRGRRLAAAIVFVGALVAAGFVDRNVVTEPPEPTQGPQMPIAASATARSSAFFCTGATATSEGRANGTVVIANAGRDPLSGTVTAVPSEGDPASAPVTVPAASRVDVALTDLVTAPYVSATVVLDAGEAVVELVGSGELGTTITPCASAASREWYFAEGITTRDASEVLTLFNPFPEDALVQLSFMTEEGQVTPEELTGLSVPGRSTVAVDLADQVQRREQVATSIQVRTGRLVAARLQSFDGSASRRGVAITLGAPSAGTEWYFPDGLATDGLDERVQLFNPSETEASVEIDLVLEEGNAEPILLAVPPESRLTVHANDEARIPQGQGHGFVVREVTGVGIVAERVIDGLPSGPRRGAAYTMGARMAMRRWVLAAGRADESFEEHLVVLNPSDAPVRVSVELLDGGSPSPITSLQSLEVGAGARLAIDVGEAVPAGPTPMLVTADGPVVVERSLHRRGGIGTTMGMGIPLR